MMHSANIYYLDLVNEGLIGPIWYKIEPITWYVDMSNKLLISKNLITSNANYTTLDEIRNESKITWNDSTLKKAYKEYMNKLIENAKSTSS